LGEAANLLDIQHARREEYHSLSKQEKKALVDEFIAERETHPKIRITTRSRMQDVTNAVRNMESLVGLHSTVKRTTN
jgi:hypothetical protein